MTGLHIGRELFYQRMQAADKIDVQTKIAKWCKDFSPTLSAFRNKLLKFEGRQDVVYDTKHNDLIFARKAVTEINLDRSDLILTRKALSLFRPLLHELFPNRVQGRPVAEFIVHQKLATNPTQLDQFGLVGHISSLEKFLKKAANGSLKSAQEKANAIAQKQKQPQNAATKFAIPQQPLLNAPVITVATSAPKMIPSLRGRVSCCSKFKNWLKTSIKTLILSCKRLFNCQKKTNTNKQ